MDILQIICEAFTDSVNLPEKDTPEYAALLDAYSENLDALSHSLDEEQKPLFFETEAQRNLIGAMDEDRFFRCGFQIGAKLMLDILRPQTQ